MKKWCHSVGGHLPLSGRRGERSGPSRFLNTNACDVVIFGQENLFLSGGNLTIRVQRWSALLSPPIFTLDVRLASKKTIVI